MDLRVHICCTDWGTKTLEKYQSPPVTSAATVAVAVAAAAAAALLTDILNCRGWLRPDFAQKEVRDFWASECYNMTQVRRRRKSHNRLPLPVSSVPLVFNEWRCANMTRPASSTAASAIGPRPRSCVDAAWPLLPRACVLPTVGVGLALVGVGLALGGVGWPIVGG